MEEIRYSVAKVFVTNEKETGEPHAELSKYFRGFFRSGWFPLCTMSKSAWQNIGKEMGWTK